MSARGYNVFNTIFYSANLMVYLEKHKILEIFTELMILIGKVRPVNIEKFIAENIKDVEDRVHRRLTLLLIPTNFGKVTHTWKSSLRDGFILAIGRQKQNQKVFFELLPGIETGI